MSTRLNRRQSGHITGADIFFKGTAQNGVENK